MQLRVFLILFISACIAFASHAVYAKRLYRLVDQYGNTLFSDQVPPEQAQDRRELLSPTGRVVEITERAKSKEQLELEKHLEELRKEEEKLIARQRVHDNALLSTYHSKEEIDMALKIKMQFFDNERSMLQNRMNEAVRQLQEQQKQAASFERAGETIPQKLLDNMKLSERNIEEIKSAMIINKDKQMLAKNELSADIERFLFLTQSVKKESPLASLPSLKQANALGLFYCENDHQCNKAWEIARKFVNKHSTTQPDVYNERLIMNRPPAKDTDISLSLSRIAVTDNDYQLFLDIHCQNSAIGEELCSSPRIKELRTMFRAFVNDELSRESSTRPAQ